MTDSEVLASPYKFGSSVSSVELLLEARTAAEGAVELASRQLGATTRMDNPFVVTGASPGPADCDGTLRFVAEAKSGVLGSLLVQPSTVVKIADVIMGGRGLAGDERPSALEVDLFAQRLIGPVGIILDAIAPGRPEPLALIEREGPTAARSIVVELRLQVGDGSLVFLVEVLAHHLADEIAETEKATAEGICNSVPLELTFKFPAVQLPARDVAALVPGDVICLEHEMDKVVVGEVDGTPLVTGRVGTSRQRVAVEVLDLIERNE